jgi:hypothetical protein
MANRKPRDQIGQHSLLAGKKVTAPGRVDPDSIRLVERDQRVEASHDPTGEPPKRFAIFFRFGCGEHQIAHEGLRVRYAHAAVKSRRPRRGVSGDNNAPRTVTHDGDKGPAIRRRAVALPTQPVGRPRGKEQRGDPAHRTPP